MRVGRVVCKVDPLAEGSKLGEADVEALFALIDHIDVGAVLAGPMEQELDELGGQFIGELLKVLFQLVHEVELYCLVLKLEDGVDVGTTLIDVYVTAITIHTTKKSGYRLRERTVESFSKELGNDPVLVDNVG